LKQVETDLTCIQCGCELRTFRFSSTAADVPICPRCYPDLCASLDRWPPNQSHDPAPSATDLPQIWEPAGATPAGDSSPGRWAESYLQTCVEDDPDAVIYKAPRLGFWEGLALAVAGVCALVFVIFHYTPVRDWLDLP
jgi:hypothetical protein